GGRTRGPAPAARGRVHQGRRAGGRAALGAAELGQAGRPVPLQPARPRAGGYPRADPAGRRGRGGPAVAGPARLAGAVPRARAGRSQGGGRARTGVPRAEGGRRAPEPVRGELAREFHRLGFKFVTLDLDGFRSGSLNELVPLELKTKYQTEAAR